MQNKKVEDDDQIPGAVFLEKPDNEHKDLLRELNGYLNGQLDHLNKRWDLCFDKSNQNYNQEIANFAQEHYNTFIAAMQNGLPAFILNQLKSDNEKAFLNIIKQADEKGMILARYNGQVYLINTKDKNNKTLNLIDNNQINNLKKIVVKAHPYMKYDVFSEEACSYSPFDGNILYLYPLNDKFLSFISSRQTERVEDTCRIINHFTEKSNNKQMDVTLEGTSQGVDFITKMVGSTHGKGNTRIKNAAIDLFIDAPHIFQDEEKIVKRLINGVKNNNTIKNISIYNSMRKCIHPTCKTNNLIGRLEYYKKSSNALNNVTIVDLRSTSSKQQHTFN